MTIIKNSILRLTLCIILAAISLHCSAQTPVRPGLMENRAKIKKKTADSLFFDNGQAVAKKDIRRFHYWHGQVQQREHTLRVQGTTQFWTNPTWKFAYDSSIYYHNRLPSWFKDTRGNSKRYVDSL